MNRHFLIFLDKTVFRVAFWFLTLYARWRGTRPIPEPASIPAEPKLLVIRPGGLGDGLMAVPFLRALRAAYPRARLTVGCMKKNLGALSVLPYQDETIAVDGIGRIFQTCRNLNRAGFDAVFDLEPFRRISSMVSYTTGSPLRIGFDTNSRRLLYSNLVAYSNDKEFDTHNALRQLKVIGIVPDDNEAADLSFELDAQPREQADALLHAEGVNAATEDLVAVAAGVLKPHHRWVMKEFAALVRKILDHDPKTRVLFVGAPADQADTEEVLRLLGPEPRVTNLVGKSSFPVSLGVLARCRLLVACDGGVVYMGAAMGCEVLSLWGPGVMERFAPPGPQHIAYRKDYACIPCVQYDRLGEFPACPYGRRCYNDMTAAEVFEQYRALTSARV